jgi:hypothetical protein
MSSLASNGFGLGTRRDEYVADTAAERGVGGGGEHPVPAWHLGGEVQLASQDRVYHMENSGMGAQKKAPSDFKRHRGPRGSAPPVGGATVPSPSPHRRSTGTEPRTPAAASRDSVARRLPRHHPGWATPGIGAPPAHKRDRGIRSWAQGMRRPRDRYVR